MPCVCVVADLAWFRDRSRRSIGPPNLTPCFIKQYWIGSWKFHYCIWTHSWRVLSATALSFMWRLSHSLCPVWSTIQTASFLTNNPCMFSLLLTAEPDTYSCCDYKMINNKLRRGCISLSSTKKGGSRWVVYTKYIVIIHLQIKGISWIGMLVKERKQPSGTKLCQFISSSVG